MFLSASALSLAGWIATSLAAIAGGHVLLSRRLFGASHPGWTPHDLGYLSPLMLGAFPLIALVNLVPAAQGHVFAWAYVGIDLRPLVMAAAALAFAAAIDRRSGGTLSAPVGRLARRALATNRRCEIAIVLGAAAFAWFSAPATRFDAALSGDEPKYMRYCENWYQGRGMELSGIQTLADLPADYSPPLLRNLTAFARTAPDEARALLGDAGRLRTSALNQRFNRARYLGNWFLLGKNGGVYQIHTPGISLLVFPAYLVDRYLLNWTCRYPQTPLELLASNTLMFVLYLAYAVVTFRFLRAFGHAAAVAGLLALALVVSLPVANFPFQFYPEVAAGLFVVGVMQYLLFGDRVRPGAAAVAGAATGYLPWLHVRFLSVVALLLVAAVVTRRGSRRAAAAFAFAAALPIALMCLYAYHVTGSLLPTALYDSRGEVLELGSIGPGLFGFAFDRSFGTLPQAPILLLAFAGIVPALRRRPAAALFCGAVLFVGAATAASHDFMAAATTPGRYLVSILPLALVGAAAAFDRFRASRLFRVTAGALLALSVHTAWTYNQHHLKSMSTMVDASVSGWKLHLLFPDIHGREWREAGFSSGFLYVWLIACALLVALPWLVDRLRRPTVVATGWSYTALIVAVLCAIGFAGTISSAAAPRAFDPQYLEKPHDARVQLLDTARSGGYWLSASSSGRRVRREALAGGAFAGLTLTPSSATVPLGIPVSFVARPDSPDDDAFRSGRFAIDFGDGQSNGPRSIAGALTIAHRYAPGLYAATATLVTGGRTFVQRSAVAVGLETAGGSPAGLTDLSAVRGLPSALVAAREGFSIDRVSVASGSICVEARRPAGASTLWVGSRTSTGWQARGYPLSLANCAAVDDADAPDYAHFAALIVAGGATPVRSSVLVMLWPERAALIGAPVLAGSDRDRFELPLMPADGRAPRPESPRALSAAPSAPTRR